MLEMFKNLITEEEGQGMAEYALILGVLAIGIVVVLGLFGDAIEGVFTSITDTFNDSTTP